MNKTWRLVLEGTAVLILIFVVVPILSGMILTWLYVPQMIQSESSSIYSFQASTLLMVGLAIVVLLVYLMVRTGVRRFIRKGKSSE